MDAMMTSDGAGPSTYQSFAKVFASYHDQYSAGPSNQIDSGIRYDVVLDEEGGMVRSLMNSLEVIIRKNASQDAEGDVTEDEKTALKREHRTWQLIRAVLENRLGRLEGSLSPLTSKQAVKDNPYISPEELTQILVNEDSELSLFATLIGHLQSRPLLESPPMIEARHGYLPTTVRRAKAAKLARQPCPASLDPDFTIRNAHGESLAGEDQTYQAPLLETLFDLIRHGEFDQALTVCEEGGEPWRAASLMGGRRWNMGGMVRNSPDGPISGNRTRALWKKSCRAIANNPTLSPAERHLYAALVSDLSTLLPACKTWEDHLWAQVQARIESRIDRKARETGGFWSEEDQLLGRDEGAPDVQGGIDDVFAKIAECGVEDVQGAVKDPYFVAQRMIIQGRADVLIDEFASKLPYIDEMMSPELIPPLVRFFTHLVLALRTLGQPVPDSAANLIIERYLTILEHQGNDSLVAMYAACLREGSGEESYARFLRAMDPNSTRDAKVEALHRARQHNLDVAVIAKETVRMILTQAFAAVPPLTGDQPDPTRLHSGVDEKDVHLIRTIEWLTMTPETADEALIQANTVARYFLTLGQTHAAQSLFKSLPGGLVQAFEDDEELESQVMEHAQYQQLFAVYSCHHLVDEVLSRTPKNTATKMEQHQWQKSLGSAIDRTERATVGVLTGDWLRFDLSGPDTSTQRSAELRRIRQIYIPDLVMRLHNLIVSQRHHSSSYLQRALDLSKIVAAEDNHVYEEFFGKEGSPYRLIAYLERVKEASLAVLETGSSNPFEIQK